MRIHRESTLPTSSTLLPAYIRRLTGVERLHSTADFAPWIDSSPPQISMWLSYKSCGRIRVSVETQLPISSLPRLGNNRHYIHLYYETNSDTGMSRDVNSWMTRWELIDDERERESEWVNRSIVLIDSELCYLMKSAHHDRELSWQIILRICISIPVNTNLQ